MIGCKQELDGSPGTSGKAVNSGLLELPLLARVGGRLFLFAYFKAERHSRNHEQQKRDRAFYVHGRRLLSELPPPSRSCLRAYHSTYTSPCQAARCFRRASECRCAWESIAAAVSRPRKDRNAVGSQRTYRVAIETDKNAADQAPLAFCRSADVKSLETSAQRIPACFKP